MFSGNNRISGRQAFRLLTYDLLGLSTLLVPGVLGKVSGRDGIFCIAIGVAVCILYLKLIGVLVTDIKTTFPCYLEEKLGKIPGRLVIAGYFIYFILLAGYTAYLFSDAVLYALLREESFYLVLTVLMVLAAYGLWDGIEGRARIYEMLFWFLMIPLFLMLFFAMDEIQVDYWSPIFMTDAGGIFEGCYYVFSCLVLIFLLLFLGGYVQNKNKLIAAGKTALLFAGGIHIVLYLILLGIFGADALGTMEYPAVTMMSTVKISGGFLKRTDSFMFAVWFFTLYALLGSCIFYGGNVLRHLLNPLILRVQEKRRIMLTSAAAIVLVYAIACIFYKSERCFLWYEDFLRYIGTPFVAAVPVLLAAMKFFCGEKNSKGGARKISAVALFLLSGSVMGGCATAELEDRNFPIEIAVQDTDAFAQGFMDAQGTGNRMIDYSHLKLVVLSEAFIEDEAAMEELLALLEEKNELPRNTYVVVAEDAQEILDMEESLGESVGNYLEQQFENVSQVRKQAYPTLGMLYQEEENRMETLLIPYVVNDGDKPVVEKYYVWKRAKASGTVDHETGQLSFFTKNEVEDYTLTLEDGTMLSLFDAHNQVDFAENGGRRSIVVTVHCSGETVNRGVASGKSVDKEAIRREVEEYFNRLATAALRNQQVDVADSYRKLGGIRRDWYMQYEAGKHSQEKHTEQKQNMRAKSWINAADYEKDMDIVYNVQIDWINL